MLIRTILVAFSMYSALPVPQLRWTRENTRYVLLAFPLVGAVIGGFCWLWMLLCRAWSFPAILRGAGLCLLPVILSGGIHLDGYADTCDALASQGSIQDKQRILRDPHIGAFAAIRLGMYFAASLSLWTALPRAPGLWLLWLFCLSRALSGLSLLTLPLASGSSLARGFAEASSRQTVRVGLLLICALCCIGLLLGGAWPAIPAAAAQFLWLRHTAAAEFGGMSGDLAGWFLQKAELWMLGAICLWQCVDAVL